MTKEEVLEKVEDGGVYKGSQVKHYVNMVSGFNKPKPPSKLKRGDVISYNPNSAKTRPFVVVKVVKGGVWALSLSTTRDGMVLQDIKTSSRFFIGSYFSKTLAFLKEDYALSHFIGVFDDNKSLAKAVLRLRDILHEDKVF